MSELTYKAVLEATIELVKAHVDDVEVAEGTRFAGDLALDSIEVMDLVSDIEDHFDITIPLNMLPEMQTVGQTAQQLLQIIQES